EAAFAVRQIETGLASLLSVLFGLTISVFAISMLSSQRFPLWLGGLGLLGALGTVAAGFAQSYKGFSELSMGLSMPAGMVLRVWAIFAGMFMWRLASHTSNADTTV